MKYPDPLVPRSAFFSFLFFSFTYPLSILISGFSLVTTLFFPLLSLTWLHLVTSCIYV